MSLQDHLRFWSPILAPFFTVVTLIVCIILTKTNNIYVGSLAWPYFSDMGRDDPAYYVFVVGLCLTAFFLVLTWFFNYKYQQYLLAIPSAKAAATASLSRCTLAAAIMGIVSTIGLPILSIYRVSYPHPEVHNYAAYFFFVFQAAAVFVNTYSTRRLVVIFSSIQGGDTQLPSLRRTWHIQAAFAAVFLVAFILYIPVGLAIVCNFERLTISKCIAEGLGNDYCTNTIRYDATLTKLYDYSNCLGINQMRSASQLACILTLVGYALSFGTHKWASSSSSSYHAGQSGNNL